MSTLRLGPLPKTEMVKLTISLPIKLKQELEQYATLHSQLYDETVEAAGLIPHMLESFVSRDRGFQGHRRTLNKKRGIDPRKTAL